MLRSAHLLLIFTMIALVGCASSNVDEQEYSYADSISDPFENYNRAIFDMNVALDDAILAPAARGYRAAVPRPARRGVRNVLRNLRSPVLIGNELLQGDISGAGDATTRLIVNTFLGVGGLFDVAGSEGINYEHEDFGQTLAVWGVGDGPYMVNPFLGVGNARDWTGYVVDSYADPIRWYLFNTDNENWYYARTAVSVVDQREELLETLDDLRENSLDYYAAVRSSYYQRREALIKDFDPDTYDETFIPDYDDE